MIPCFIYYSPRTQDAWPETSRNDIGTAILLFTCPEDWKPKDQAEFEAAAEFYGVRHASKIKYDADLIPF
jgi:hypothetical protein